MRKVIVASLALFPILLHAQAKSPAQPQGTLQSKLIQPVAFGSSSEAANTTTAAVRVTTGVVAPKLIHTVEISRDEDSAWKLKTLGDTAVVGMVVDETGKPTNLKIIQSTGSPLDQNVLAAVSQYRFKPGTLDNQPTAVPVNLTVVMVAPGH